MNHNAGRSPRYGPLSLTAAALVAAVIGLGPTANATGDDDENNGQSTGTGQHQSGSAATDHAPSHRGPGLHDRQGPHRSRDSAEPKRKHRDKSATDKAAVDKPAADKPATDKPAGDKASTDAASSAGPDAPTHTSAPPPQQDSPPAVVVVAPPVTVQGQGTLASGPQEVAGSLPTTGILPPGYVAPIESAPSIGSAPSSPPVAPVTVAPPPVSPTLKSPLNDMLPPLMPNPQEVLDALNSWVPFP